MKAELGTEVHLAKRSGQEDETHALLRKETHLHSQSRSHNQGQSDNTRGCGFVMPPYALCWTFISDPFCPWLCRFLSNVDYQTNKKAEHAAHIKLVMLLLPCKEGSLSTCASSG
eukprot:4919200-Amphidinium_carterae.1